VSKGVILESAASVHPSLGQGGRLNPINKVLVRLVVKEYNKPEGRAVDRYGLKWSCPGEPYGLDYRGPGAACPNPKYNKPEGRPVNRYGLEWRCPGEPYDFDLRGPRAACLNPEYQKPRYVQSRSQHRQEQCVRDSVSSKPATTSRQPRNTERAMRKRPGPHAEG